MVDGKSDILYTGDSGTWSFDILGAGLSVGDYSTAMVTASLVLDDHSAVATSDYKMEIKLDGSNAFSGSTDLINLNHGLPFGTVFTNWTSAVFPASSLGDPFDVWMKNTGTDTASSDWIAIDYIELTLKTSAPVPEPATMLLLGCGLVGLVGFRRKFKK